MVSTYSSMVRMADVAPTQRMGRRFTKQNDSSETAVVNALKKMGQPVSPVACSSDQRRSPVRWNSHLKKLMKYSE